VENYKKYLNLSENDIEPYDHLDNIEEAVECFTKHFDNCNPIGILVDTDTDGVCSATIMAKYILSMKCDYPVHMIVHQKNKAHGLESHDFKIPDGVRLMIVPDSSSNDIDECQKLIDANIDVIVLDHHEKSDDRKYPGILINNQTSVNYYNKAASGTHVTWDFLRALDEYYWEDYASQFVDLVALANIADVMNIKSESTRAAINLGLQNINNKMFEELVRSQNFSMKGRTNPHTIAFCIAPMINAFLRLAEFEERELLIRALCEDEFETFEYTKRGASSPTQENIYEHMVRLMTSYRGKQNRSRDKSVKLLLDMAQECDNDKVAVMDATSEIDQSLTGLVAIRISEAINKPVLLVRKHNDELAGSGRAFNNCPIEDFRALTEQCPYITMAQGHNAAFGCSLPVENLENVRNWFNEKLDSVSMDKVYAVDFIIDVDDLAVGFIQTIDKHQDLWGQGLAEPLVAIENIALKRSDVHVQGKNFDSIAFTVNDIKYVLFKLHETDALLEWASAWEDDDSAIVINVVAKVSLNEYQGVYTPQCMIEAYTIQN
jgi:single-stranded-DNA-specific exonuclease